MKPILDQFIFIPVSHLISHSLCASLYCHLYSISIHSIAVFTTIRFFILLSSENLYQIQNVWDCRGSYEWHRIVAHFFGWGLKIYETAVSS